MEKRSNASEKATNFASYDVHLPPTFHHPMGPQAYAWFIKESIIYFTEKRCGMPDRDSEGEHALSALQ